MSNEDKRTNHPMMFAYPLVTNDEIKCWLLQLDS